MRACAELALLPVHHQSCFVASFTGSGARYRHRVSRVTRTPVASINRVCRSWSCNHLIKPRRPRVGFILPLRMSDSETTETNSDDGKEGSDWISDLVLQGIKLGIKTSGDHDEASYDAATILHKLKEIMSIVASRVEEVSDDLPWWCFISLVQLNESIKKRHPEYRDRSYREGAGEDVSVEDLKELSEGVDLAEWAYEEKYAILKKKLRSRDYVLLRHEMSCEPGRVGHYIAINHRRKVALIGLKGTSTFSDLVTDAAGKPVEYILENSFDESHPSKTIQCHEGIWTAALTMAEDLEELISNLFLPSGYKVLICGHSLGAGTACLLGILLRSRIPTLRGDTLRVLAIATPPVLNHEAAIAATSFCTSLVNNNDIVPRMSLSNLVQLAKLLVKVDGIVQEQGRKPKDLASAIRYVQDLMHSDNEPIMTCEEVDEYYAEQSDSLNHVDNLFVPGRVVTMWCLKQKSEKTNIEGDENPLKEEKNGEENVQQAREIVSEEEKDVTKKKVHLEDEVRAEKIEREMSRITEIDAVAGNGGMRMLRQIELEDSFLDDHGTEYYAASIQALLQKLEGC